jgi:hypothetical protein
MTEQEKDVINVCARCRKRFKEGITIWRVSDGWIHPECATDGDKKFMENHRRKVKRP